MFAGNFAPAGWMFCNGQLLAISENDTLFLLIGTTYGGDGQTTFALPNLQSRVPIHWGNGVNLADTGGVEQVTLTTNQIPVHNHAFVASNTIASNADPAGQQPSQSSLVKLYVEDTPTVNMANAVGAAGGSQPHNNLQPYICVNYIISLFGIFPTVT